jgi:PKD repeat protein
VPKAVLAVKTAAPRSRAPVQFEAGGSTDREAGIGGEIVKYRWSFGDGQSAETTTPQASHTYGAEGSVTATLSVVDKQGAASEPASVTLKIADGPAVAITRPSHNQTIKRSRTTTKTVTKAGRKTKVKTTELTPIAIAGTATDTSGVKGVLITVEKLGTGKRSAKSRCTWLDPSKGLVTPSPCSSGPG